MSPLFIVNPLSERVAQKGSTLEVLSTETDTPLFSLDTFDDLPDIVANAAKSGIDHVIIEGGDGTAQGVLSEFLSQSDEFTIFPKFSIVPGGMTNQVAKNIGLRSAKLSFVRTLFSRSLTSVQMPMLEIVDSEGPIYAGFLFSTGAIPQITRYTTRELHQKGIGGSLAVLGGILKGMRGDDEALMKVTPVSLDDLYKGPHLGSVVTTLPSLILGLDPFWGEANGALRVTWVTGSYRRLTANILSLWAGRKTKDRSEDGLYSTQTDTLDYHYDGEIVLDGEFLSIPSGKFTVRTTRPVTFLR